MIDTLIVARDNRYGLSRDAELLADALRAAGVETAIAAVADRRLIDRLLRRPAARRIVHLERVHSRWLGAAGEHLLIPNQERFPTRHLGRLKRIDRVLAKTLEACAAFAGKGAPVDHLGFTSQDRHDPTVERDRARVFHLAGGSTLKGTEDILALWGRHPEWPELVLVQKAKNAPAHVPDNVRLLSGYIDDAELRRLQNACQVHLCPSRAEGWGHNIVEALSCGAVVVTTDAAPMNELVVAGTGILVRVARSEPRHLGTCHFVDRDALEKAIEAAISMPGSAKSAMGDRARRRFVEIDARFRRSVRDLFGGGTGGVVDDVAVGKGSVNSYFDAVRHSRLRTAFRDFFRRRRVARHLARGGQFAFHGLDVEVPDNVGVGIANALIRGKYERAEASMVIAHLPRDLPVIELGGSLGLMSRLIRSRLDPKARMLILEANPDVLDVCRANALREAAPGSTEIVNAALYYGGPTARFRVGADIHTNSLSAAGDPERTVEVPALTLAELHRRIGSPEKFALVCDIEGAEYAMFEKDGAILSGAAVCIVEIHPRAFMRSGHTEADFMRHAAAAGLEVVDRVFQVVVLKPRAAPLS